MKAKIARVMGYDTSTIAIYFILDSIGFYLINFFCSLTLPQHRLSFAVCDASFLSLIHPSLRYLSLRDFSRLLCFSLFHPHSRKVDIPFVLLSLFFDSSRLLPRMFLIEELQLSFALGLSVSPCLT
ncbi:hypothetical protein V2G26_019803 [Clonostachys chloroleuca]